jgi:hypothetical protein
VIDLLADFEETLLKRETRIHWDSDLRLYCTAAFSFLLNGDFIPQLKIKFRYVEGNIPLLSGKEVEQTGVDFKVSAIVFIRS